VDFFLGDSRVFFIDLDGDFTFLGDSPVFFVDLDFAALAFLGEVASFFGLGVVVFLVDGEEVEVEVEVFFVGIFFGDETVFFFGDLAVAGLAVLVDEVDAFFEFEVDLFLGDDLAWVEGTVVEEVVDWVVDDFLVDDFFFVPGASLYEAFTLTNRVPSFRFRDIFTCFRAKSKSIL